MAAPRTFPPNPTTGDPTDSELFETIGRSLSSWEFVEANLASLVAYLAPAGEPRLTFMRSYGENTGFSYRVKAAHKAATAFFATQVQDPALAARVTALIGEYERLAPFRNDVAHGIVQQYAGGGFALFPAYHATKYRPIINEELEWTGASYIYSSAEIRAFMREIAPLYEEAMQLVSMIINAQRASGSAGDESTEEK